MTPAEAGGNRRRVDPQLLVVRTPPNHLFAPITIEIGGVYKVMSASDCSAYKRYSFGIRKIAAPDGVVPYKQGASQRPSADTDSSYFSQIF